MSLPILKKIKPLTRKLYYKVVVRAGDYLEAGELQETLKTVLDTHLDEYLSQITTKTLVLWGEKDTYTPLWQGEVMARSIPGAQLQVVEGATHGLPLQHPQVVASTVEKFLRS